VRRFGNSHVPDKTVVEWPSVKLYKVVEVAY